MPCAFPLRLWRVGGKWVPDEPVVSGAYRSQLVNCSQCAPCRLSKGAQWSCRLEHEGYMHEVSCCATFTYAPEHLPELGSLCKAHMAAAIKRLRSAVSHRGGPLFSVDVCGEYSPELMRPHYHVAFFGYFPPDAVAYAKSQAGNQEFISEELSSAWGFGLVTFQDWSQGAAAYCAGHQAWKLTGQKARDRLAVLDAAGVVVGLRHPEFHQPSTRPGIGRRFVEAYQAQLLALGSTVSACKEVPLPSYYLRRAEISDPVRVEALRVLRRADAELRAADLTAGRRAAIEGCAEARILRSSRKSGSL